MSQVIMNESKADFLQQEKDFLNTLTLRLFTNDHVPAAGDTVSSYTELSGSPYAAVTNVGFGDATLNGSNQGQITAPAVTFSLPYSGTPYWVYGCYYTQPGGTKVAMAERAADPFQVTAAGRIFVVTPKKVMTTL